MKSMRLLFIHGAGGTKSKWRKVEDHLDSVPFTAIDLPGHGDNEYNIITSIQDYSSFIDEEIKENTIIVGHSMGGLVALEVAARNNKVKGVVLAASFYELQVHPNLLTKLADGKFPESLFYASYGKEASESLIKEEKKELRLVPTGVSYADFRATNEYKEGKATLASLDIPVCAILGDQDRLLPPGAAQTLKEVKPDIHLFIINGSGHYVMLEKPKEFCEELAKFVKKVQLQLVNQ